YFFFSSRRRHTRCYREWSSDVCSSDLCVVFEDPQKQHISLSLFIEQLDYLQRNHQVISLTDYLNAVRNNHRVPDRSAVLMFDDGFEDFFSIASKELIRRGLPATVFVISDVASGRFSPNGYSFMSWQIIKALVYSGIHIGSHTASHRSLPNIPVDDARKELSDSCAAVSDVTQAAVPLSYPYGQTSEQIGKLAESLGYSCGITGALGPNDRNADLYELKRTVIASDDDLAT